jgi:hypothetical protein
MSTLKLNRGFLVAALTAVFASSGCSDLFTVENPGMIEDAALNRPEAVAGLVGGMSGDYSYALGYLAFGVAIFTHELSYAGAYDYHLIPASGTILPEHSDLFYWGNLHRARWVAESGIERLKSILGPAYDASELAARANLFAGFSNRALGENMCYAVVDGGPAEPNTAHFARAESYFTEAMRIAQNAGNDAYLTAARAGRATVRAWQGNWAGAVEDAGQVPASFVFEASFSTNTTREINRVVEETVVRFESSVWGTYWAEAEDPRTPYVIAFDAGGAIRTGRDGFTPVYIQQKYQTLASNIPIAKGTEMLLIRAEAALRAGNVAEAVDRINDVRAFREMTPVSASGQGEAWELLKHERGAELWLEGRRFWDLRRWYEDGVDDFMEGRDRCIPIGDIEMRNNPNLR